jgi:hypothetical protein
MTPETGYEASIGQPAVFQFEEISDDVGKIRPGDTVIGFADLGQVDRLVPPLADLALYPSLGQYRSGHYNRARPLALDAGGRLEYPGWPRNAFPSVALQPQRVRGRQLFSGAYANTSVTLLSDMGDQPNDVQPREIAILLDTEMHSSGRGFVGRSSKLLTVSEIPSPSGKRPPSRRVKYTALEGDTANLAAEFLLTESASIARQIAVNGLNNVILAGLPSLGKRR